MANEALLANAAWQQQRQFAQLAQYLPNVVITP
jgi:hypothetical protein